MDTLVQVTLSPMVTGRCDACLLTWLPRIGFLHRAGCPDLRRSTSRSERGVVGPLTAETPFRVAPEPDRLVDGP